MAFSEGTTTIVLGAGASREAGLPVGRDLKAVIANLLDIRYEHGSTRISGAAEIDSAFRIRVRDRGERDINPYLHACWRIRDAMPQAISIDNYLDVNPDDELLIFSGKLAIAQAILKAERESSIFLDQRQGQQMLEFATVEDTWFNKFVQLLTENCRLSSLADSLSNVTVISFNYDRCFEHFLSLAIQNYYRIEQNEAADILRNLQIFHPYGRVGSLLWQREDLATDFGAEPHPDNLLQISSQIRTFTEGTNPEASNIEEIRQCVASCDRLIFLGFAYHPMNMQLLASQQEGQAPAVSFGTALGLSGPDCEILSREIKQLVGPEIPRVELRNDLTCSQLFDEYWRSLTTL